MEYSLFLLETKNVKMLSTNEEKKFCKLVSLTLILIIWILWWHPLNHRLSIDIKDIKHELTVIIAASKINYHVFGF